MQRLLVYILLVIPVFTFAYKTGITITKCQPYVKNNSFVLIQSKSNLRYIIKTNNIDICKNILHKTIGGYPVYLCDDYQYKSKRNCHAIQYQKFEIPSYRYNKVLDK